MSEDVAAYTADVPNYGFSTLTGKQLDYDSNSFCTPIPIIEAARGLMGSIDTDPASNEFAQKRINASVYYTVETNGLDKPWYGNIWLNPPYGRDVKLFIYKVVTEHRLGNLKKGLVLVNSYTDPYWYQLLSKEYPYMFTKYRIQFDHPDVELDQNRMGQTMFAIGDIDLLSFFNTFSTWFYAPLGILAAYKRGLSK